MASHLHAATAQGFPPSKPGPHCQLLLSPHLHPLAVHRPIIVAGLDSSIELLGLDGCPALERILHNGPPVPPSVPFEKRVYGEETTSLSPSPISAYIAATSRLSGVLKLPKRVRMRTQASEAL
eukprot:scaffold54627_cov33-Tisochrysis_lutea.AAC.1